MNIRNIHHNNSKNKNLKSKEDNNINVINKNEIDLDLLFEKQLQKLREINSEFDINEKNKNEDNKNLNNIIDIDKKNQNEKFEDIKGYTLFSNYSKSIKSLPRIQSPKSKTIFQQKEENSQNNDGLMHKNKSFHKNNNTQLRPISSKIKNPQLHKDFGKIPKYIQEMKLKNEILKDIKKKKKEEEKYPKGTKLLTEEERLFTLQKLKESKKELENLLEKLPITLNSLSSRNKQQKLYKELDEIEQAITTFSKKQVFVKIDN